MSEKLPVKRDLDTRATVPEVAFALVLSRLIEAAHRDPSQLRSSIYQIARVKLQEQLALEAPAEALRLRQAMEKAIQGVEQFSQRTTVSGANGFIHGGPSPGEILRGAAKPRPVRELLPNVATIDHRAPSSKGGGAWLSSRGGLAFVVGSIGVFAVVTVLAVIGVLAGMGAAAYLASDQRHNPPLASLQVGDRPSQATSSLSFGDKSTSITHTPETVSTKVEPQSSPLPDHFGVFAVSSNQLLELEQLPGRAPDVRVAISAAIAQPAKTTVPDGRVKFIVYRRDSAIMAVERAEVRVMARIARALTFEASGKSAMAQDNGARWVIRNISYPLRAAPIREAADMYELRAEDADFVLTPGRYVLVVKGTAYDFAVHGDITDPHQCLDRTQASNGIFYTECRMP